MTHKKVKGQADPLFYFTLKLNPFNYEESLHQMPHSPTRIDYLEKMLTQLIKDNQILQQRIDSLEGRTHHLEIISKTTLDNIRTLKDKCIDMESSIENVDMRLDMK